MSSPISQSKTIRMQLLIAMCVNDIICCGAKPLFFLDYIAIGKNDPKKVAAIVSGVAEGCVQSGCALIGGETAEHPGVMERPSIILRNAGMASRCLALKWSQKAQSLST